MSTQIIEQINSSELPSKDKEDFIFFLKNISDEELSQLTTLFDKNPSSISPFWLDLKDKLFFMELLDKNTDFPNEAKDDIKTQISQMNPEEFNTFLTTIEDVANGEDITKKMTSLLEQSKKNDIELSSLTADLIS